MIVKKYSFIFQIPDDPLPSVSFSENPTNRPKSMVQPLEPRSSEEPANMGLRVFKLRRTSDKSDIKSQKSSGNGFSSSPTDQTKFPSRASSSTSRPKMMSKPSFSSSDDISSTSRPLVQPDTKPHQERRSDGNLESWLNRPSSSDHPVVSHEAQSCGIETKLRVKRSGWQSRKGRVQKRLAVGLSQTQKDSDSLAGNKSTVNVSCELTVHKNSRAPIGGEIRARGSEALARLQIENDEMEKQNVRTRVTDRNAAIGTDCSQCKDFYSALNQQCDEECHGKRSDVQCVSKHRFHQVLPSTPHGFWDVQFPESSTEGSSTSSFK